MRTRTSVAWQHIWFIFMNGISCRVGRPSLMLHTYLDNGDCEITGAGGAVVASAAFFQHRN